MKRILHTIDTTGPGGAETVFVNLAKGLPRQEYDPVVAIRGPGWVCAELRKNGLNPLFISSKGAFNSDYLRELVRIIRKYKIDIIQSHLLGSNLYCSLAGAICGVPVVSTFHGFVDINERERFFAVKRMIVNRGSARLVFVSDRLKEFYVVQKGFLARKSVTIYNGVDTNHFRPQRDDSLRRKLGIESDNILVGAVGNIRPAKGYEYLLQAAKLVVDRHPQFRFVVAGEGFGSLFDDLKVLRNKLGLEKYFFFKGFEPDVSRFMNNLDVFVLSSVSEGFSITTIEAMACGVPVIVTRSGGPEEIVRHLDNGILVDACSPENLAKGLIDLQQDELIKPKIIIKGVADARRHYSSIKCIEFYLKLYRLLSKVSVPLRIM
jgi:glycosyltransferase involved in cell wall biosynthesis